MMVNHGTTMMECNLIVVIIYFFCLFALKMFLLGLVCVLLRVDSMESSCSLGNR